MGEWLHRVPVLVPAYNIFSSPSGCGTVPVVQLVAVDRRQLRHLLAGMGAGGGGGGGVRLPWPVPVDAARSLASQPRPRGGGHGVARKKGTCRRTPLVPMVVVICQRVSKGGGWRWVVVLGVILQSFLLMTETAPPLASISGRVTTAAFLTAITTSFGCWPRRHWKTFTWSASSRPEATAKFLRSRARSPRWAHVVRCWKKENEKGKEGVGGWVRSCLPDANSLLLRPRFGLQLPEGRHYALKIIFNYGIQTNEMRNAYANEYLVRVMRDVM